MRVVGGTLRGRRFSAPSGTATRPTLDRVREAAASALEARAAIVGRRVLDLFAGSGGLTFEALSRGAARSVLVDAGRQAQRTQRRNIAALGLADRTRLSAINLLGAPRTVAAQLRAAPEAPFGLVFMDPPYASAGRMPALWQALWLAGAVVPGAAVMLEFPSKAPVDLGERFVEQRRYSFGETTMVIAWTCDDPVSTAG